MVGRSDSSSRCWIEQKDRRGRWREVSSGLEKGRLWPPPWSGARRRRMDCAASAETLDGVATAADFRNVCVAVAGPGRAPATERDALAFEDARDDVVDRLAHRTVPGDVCIEIALVRGDDSGARIVVVMVSQVMTITQDRIGTVAIDNGFVSGGRDCAALTAF